ncbi:MAG: hypothetical protein LBG76_02310 [Treponema sp.]|jgi:class 3 adenylate cyclase|nr:hypothetical protein [Treponema sp.]
MNATLVGIFLMRRRYHPDLDVKQALKTKPDSAEKEKSMAVFSKTQALVRFLVSLAAATVTAVGLAWFFAGPRLGPHYDFLLRYRPAPPLSRELVLIEMKDSGKNAEGTKNAGEMVEPMEVTSVLRTLIEMDASALILQVPVLGLSSVGGSAREELLNHFDEEFALLERNIRSLFQAIRIGSVSPTDSERYVGDLVSLTERGKERLIAALEQRDQIDIQLMEKTAAAYGNLWEAGDLRFPLNRNGDAEHEEAAPGAPHYGKPRPDKDGVFRRIAPVLTEETGAEHIVYALLKQRYNAAIVEDAEDGPALMLARNGENIFLPLDARGALLPELPHGEDTFRRLPLELFLEYEKQEQELYRAVAAAEAGGYFAELAPEEYPSAWYYYAHALWEDLLEQGGEENRFRWLEARSGYFKALDNFINGSSETELVAEYERLLSSESLGEAAVGRVVSLRNEFIKSFGELREQYNRFKARRNDLQTTLQSSLCILGPPPEPGSRNPSDAEISAILANTILTGRALIPQANRNILICALGAAFIIALCLCRISVPATFCTGVFLMILTGAFFSWGFILTGYWLDPLIPTGTMAAGMAASCFSGLHILRRQASGLRRAYGAAITPAYLRQVIHAGKPLPHEIVTAKAAIIAIRGRGITAAESWGDPEEGARKIAEFRRTVAEHFKNAGATITGFDGDLATVVFGSPLERSALQLINKEIPYEDDIHARTNQTPIAKATGFIMELLRTAPETASWYFGIDTGEAAFSYSPITGYTVSGPPAIRARILSGLAPRYKARILVTGRVAETVEAMPVRRLNVLSNQTGNSKEPFYELIVKRGR